jgi:HSP20 family protein
MTDDKGRKGKKDEETGTAAGSTLENLGAMIPGLGGLIESLEKSPAFRGRLKEAGQEIDRRIKNGYTGEGRRGGGGRPSGRPTGRPPGARNTGFGGKPFVKKKSEPRHSPPPEPRERPVDIFDEDDYIRIIAEIPGVEEKDIKINLTGKRLLISVDKPRRKYRQDLKLPSETEGKLEQTYKNGILELKINKKAECD